MMRFLIGFEKRAVGLKDIARKVKDAGLKVRREQGIVSKTMPASRKIKTYPSTATAYFLKKEKERL